MSSVPGDSQFQPPQVFAEGAWLYGAIATAALYGIVVVFYAMCARSLWRRIRTHEGAPRKNWFFFLYVNLIFALSTLYVAANSQITQLGFINNRDYPGGQSIVYNHQASNIDKSPSPAGPSAYEENTSSTPLNVAFVVSNWCADALMVSVLASVPLHDKQTLPRDMALYCSI